MNVPEIERPLYITGKVVLPEGGDLTESATIQSICGGRRRNEAYTDTHGNFSFELKKKPSFYGPQSAEDSPFDTMGGTMQPGGQGTFQWQNCELQAVLPGYSSEVIQLSRSFMSLGANDVGRIVIHPLNHAEGTSISVTSMAAPKDAKKELEKARDQEKKQKFDEAKKHLSKAVEIYPQYAAAWSELGSLQQVGHDNVAARHSFEQSIAADPKYTNPYVGLSHVALEERKWQEVVDVSNKLLALNPVNYPNMWLMNSIGNFYLHHFDVAEKSARSGLKVDDEHHVPKLEYVLGMVLLQEQNYGQAAEHMRQYLHLSTEPQDVAEAQKQLAQIEQLSAQSGAPVAAPPQQK